MSHLISVEITSDSAARILEAYEGRSLSYAESELKAAIKMALLNDDAEDEDE